MQTTTTIRSYPAIVGGTIAAGIAWATLTRDVGLADIDLDHFQAAALVGLTILAGHLANEAWKTRKVVAAAGLTAMAVLGSVLTVYNGMGNRAEARDVKVAAASLTDGERSRIEADLAKTVKLVAEAEAWTATECRSGEGPKCKGVTFVLRQRQASKAALETQLRTVGPAPVAEPKAAQVGTIAGLLGYDGKAIRQMVSAIEPLAMPLFLEFLAIVLFGYGLGHRVSASPSISDSRQTSYFAGEIEETDCPEPTPPNGGRKSNVINFKHPAIAAIEKAGGSVSNRTLARLMQCSEGEASKRWQEVRDQLDIGRQGKELRISIKRTA